jgi:hypothetical protein
MPEQATTKSRSFSNYFYGVTLFMMVLTGFAQMPIFNRYYIADIPGFGWLGKFYVTHFMHYLFAVLFIGYAAFRIADHFLSGKDWRLPAIITYIRFAILFSIIATGALLVIRNLSGVHFPSWSIIVLDLTHLALVIALLLSFLIGIFMKRN